MSDMFGGTLADSPIPAPTAQPPALSPVAPPIEIGGVSPAGNGIASPAGNGTAPPAANGTASPAGTGTASRLASMTVDIVIPALNEERALPATLAVLHAYLRDWSPFGWTITVVDNGSTDRTLAAAEAAAAHLPHVRVLHLDRRGKGHAVATAWAASEADIVAYLDADLSTDLNALIPMLTAVASGHSDLAIGSRLSTGARPVRSLKREVTSRGYNLLLRMSHGARFRDAQCGFKAARASVIRPLLPHIQDRSWFFDTELLLLATHNGLRVLELPVDWVEDGDSRVTVGSVAATNLAGLLRVLRLKATGRARIPDLPVRRPPRALHPENTSTQSGRLGTILAFAAISVLCALIPQGSITVGRVLWRWGLGTVLAAGVAMWAAASTDWLLTSAHLDAPPRRRFRDLLGAAVLGLAVLGAPLVARSTDGGWQAGVRFTALLGVTALGLGARLAIKRFRTSG